MAGSAGTADSATRSCPWCGTVHAADLHACPRCGTVGVALEPVRRPHWVPSGVLAAVAAVGVCAFLPIASFGRRPHEPWLLVGVLLVGGAAAGLFRLARRPPHRPSARVAASTAGLIAYGFIAVASLIEVPWVIVQHVDGPEFGVSDLKHVVITIAAVQCAGALLLGRGCLRLRRSANGGRPVRNPKATAVGAALAPVVWMVAGVLLFPLAIAMT